MKDFRRARALPLARFLLLVGFMTPTVAQGQSNLVDGSIRAERGGPSVFLDTTFGYSRIEEDSFLRLDAGFALEMGAFAFGVHAPVHLTVVDHEPLNAGTVREQDWDEVSDYFRILRFLQWGSREEPDPVFIRAGELVDVSLGHRSIVDRYYNVLDPNHHKLGLEMDVEARYGGAEVFVDHLAPPSIVGIRGYVRPFTFVETAEILKRLSTGLIFTSDLAAPMSIGRFDTKSHSFRASDSRAVYLYGWDVDWSLVETDFIEWVPYFDWVGRDTAGMGLHGGQFLNLYFADWVSMSAQLEWRFATRGYQAGYFSSLYEFERWSFTGMDGSSGPKLAQVNGNEGRKDRHGFYTGLDFHFSNVLSLGATLEDEEGPFNTNLTLRAITPYVFGIQTGLFYAKRNFEGYEEVMNLQNTLLISQTRVQFWGPMFASLEYAHTFRESESLDYSPSHNAHFGVGAEFTF